MIFWKGLCFHGSGSLFSSQAWHSHSYFLSISSLFYLLLHSISVLHTETLTSSLCSLDWAPLDCTFSGLNIFWHLSSQSCPASLPKIQFSCLPVQHFLTQGPLGRSSCCRFPTAAKPNGLFFHLVSGKARTSISLETGLPSLNTLKHLSNRNNFQDQ